MIVKVKGMTQLITATSIATYTSTPAAHVVDITCLAETSTNNNGFFYLFSASNATVYVVWVNKSGTGVDPNIVNTTSVEVALTGGETDVQVATLMTTAIGGLADFSAANGAGTLAVITVTNAANGGSSLPLNGTTHTQCTFALNTQGYIAVPANVFVKIEGFWEVTKYMTDDGNNKVEVPFSRESVSMIVSERQIEWLLESY